MVTVAALDHTAHVSGGSQADQHAAGPPLPPLHRARPPVSVHLGVPCRLHVCSYRAAQCGEHQCTLHFCSHPASIRLSCLCHLLRVRAVRGACCCFRRVCSSRTALHPVQSFPVLCNLISMLPMRILAAPHCCFFRRCTAVWTDSSSPVRLQIVSAATCSPSLTVAHD